jgi:hypothetical protein
MFKNYICLNKEHIPRRRSIFVQLSHAMGGYPTLGDIRDTTVAFQTFPSTPLRATMPRFSLDTESISYIRKI